MFAYNTTCLVARLALGPVAGEGLACELVDAQSLPFNATIKMKLTNNKTKRKLPRMSTS